MTTPKKMTSEEMQDVAVVSRWMDGWTDEHVREMPERAAHALRLWGRAGRALLAHAAALEQDIAAAEARGFARAKERAAQICDAARAMAERESAASHHAPTRRGWGVLAIEQRETAERIRAMQDERGTSDGSPVDGAGTAPDDNRMCECGQPERAHDERGCFAWEWVQEEGGARFWKPSPCKAFRPHNSPERRP